MRLSISLVLLLAATSPALADDKAKAKALYEDGLKHYNLAEWTDAIKSWKEAYLISKKPLLLFNIGQAYRLSGDCKQANVFYDSYQREEPNPKNAAELEEALALCAKQPDKPADKPADKPVDKPITKPGDKTITKPSDKTKPGDKTITKPVNTMTDTPVVTAPDKPVVTDKPAVTDKPVVVAQKPEPIASEPVDSGETTSGGGLRKVGIVVGGAGVVMGGLAIYFALDASSAASDLDGYKGEWGQDQIDLEAKGERSATLGKVFGGVGIAAIAAGGVMFAIGGPKTVESSGVAIAPTRGGAAFSWSTRF